TREESVLSRVAALTTAGNRAWSAAMSVVGSCTAHWVSWALATACSLPSEPTDCQLSRKIAVCSRTGEYFCRKLILPVSWYCCQIQSAISAPLVIVSALKPGLEAVAQDASLVMPPPL